MAAPNLNTVRMTLRDQLATVPEVLSDVPIISENQAPSTAQQAQIDAQDGGVFIQEIFLPAAEATIANRMTEASGSVQYDVVVRKHTGVEAAEALAQSIADAFTPRRLSSRGLGVHIDRVERFGARQVEDKWMRFPVSVAWRTFKVFAIA